MKNVIVRLALQFQYSSRHTTSLEPRNHLRHLPTSEMRQTEAQRVPQATKQWYLVTVGLQAQRQALED